MAKLNIFLTGLCAITPPGPEFGQTTGNENGPLHVVMPASSARLSSRVSNYTIPVHLPFAVVSMADLSPDNRRREDFQVDTQHESRRVFLFSREHLSLEGDTNGTLTFQQNVASPGGAPTSSSDEGDVNWVADMRRIWAEAATIRSDCRPGARAVSGNVAAQLSIGHGLIRASFPSNSRTIMQFLPIKGSSRVVHVLCRRTWIQRDLDDKVVEFNLVARSLNDGVATTPIRLRTSASKDINITIGNADLRDVLAIARDDFGPARQGNDPDFELYYDILDVPDASERPIPLITGNQTSHDNCGNLRAK